MARLHLLHPTWPLLEQPGLLWLVSLPGLVLFVPNEGRTAPREGGKGRGRHAEVSQEWLRQRQSSPIETSVI